MSALSRFWEAKILPHVPHVIRHDFWRKLFALFFTILLSWYAHQNVKAKTEFDTVPVPRVSVKFVSLDPGVTLIPRETSVDVTVNVPKGTMLKNTDFYVECPVTVRQVEENLPVEIKPDMVKSNVRIDNLSIQAVNPEMIPLDIDVVDTKDVPVRPVYDPGELMDGYHATVVEPEKPVQIRGPKKHLATISAIETEKIPLSNVTKSFTRLVQLIPPYEKNIEILSGTVRVEVKVFKNDPRAFDGIPVEVLFGRAGANNLSIAKIQPESVSVMVDSLPDISQTQIHPFLDLSDVTRPGVYAIDIKCWSDSDRIKVIEVLPAKATVTLEAATASGQK